MSDSPSLVRLFAAPLGTSGLRYFVTGGVATIVYGEPRFTRDIDLVLAVAPSDAERFLALWPTDAFYAPPRDVVQEEAGRASHGHFNIVHIASGLTADCYLLGTDPLHAWALERVQAVMVEGVSVPFAPVEYVIIRKLQYAKQSGSTRHIEDIQRILRIQGDAVDRDVIGSWATTLDCRTEWNAAQRLS